jgi:hypothetical protein
MNRPAAPVPRHANRSTLCQAGLADLATLLRSTLQDLPADALPAALCCDRGGVIANDGWSFNVLDARHHAGRIEARVEFFFAEVVGGCSCHDDPVVHDEYRTLGLTIDCSNGALGWAPG